MGFDIFQGVMNTISPSFGGYNMNVFINIDRDPGVTGTTFDSTSFTGPGAAGVTGTGSLEAWKYCMGITGVLGTFTTNRSDEEIYY